MRFSLITFAFVIGLAGLFASGCMPANPILYTMRLSEVERPLTAKERYGEQRISKVEATGDSVKYSFEDSLVSFVWYPTPTRVYFLLTNKSNHSIKIPWDEAAFVMPSGESRRVVHTGVKYNEANSSQPPSIVARQGFLDDFVLSSDQCYLIEGLYGGWRESPFLTNDPVKAKELIGKTFRVLLPLQIEGVTNEYTFAFAIEDVKSPPKPANMNRWGAE